MKILILGFMLRLYFFVNPNPLVLDSAGSAEVYLNPAEVYTLELHEPLDAYLNAYQFPISLDTCAGASVGRLVWRIENIQGKEELNWKALPKN